MTLDGDLQTNILKKTPGLTNLFHSNVRRSRSLASLNKMSAVDVRFQSLTAINCNDEQLRRPQPKTAKTSLTSEEAKFVGKKWTIIPITSSPAVPTPSRTPSPPSRPAPAPRLWSEDGEQEDNRSSLYGLETIGAPSSSLRQRSPYATNPPGYHSSPRTPRNNSPRTGSPSTAKQVIRPRKESLSQRRNNSVAELVIDPMTTVQEVKTPQSALYQDSLSDPSPAQPVSNKQNFTPCPSEGQVNTKRSINDSMLTPTPPDLRRASSMLLPLALAPILIPGPRCPPQILQATTYLVRPPEEQKPPVPPKSPRTLFRAVPSQRSTPAPNKGRFTPSHTASSTVSTTVSINSAKSLIANATFTNVIHPSPVEMHVPWVSWSPARGINESGREYASAPPITSSPMPWTMKERSGSAIEHMTHIRGNASVDTTHTFATAKSTFTHSRNASDSSILNRGRPMKRSDVSLRRGVSRGLRLAELSGSRDRIPDGYSKIQAMATLTREQLCSLRQRAESQASAFHTLQEDDVNKLNEELALLDEHCGELRCSTISLREERQALHRRLICFLRAPGNALVSREHVVKQDSALADLDDNIDHASNKLEAAQERRSVVQRKLLEHVGAILAICVPPPSDEQTPPRSPVTGAGSSIDSQLEQLGFEEQLEREAAELDTMTRIQQDRREQEQAEKQREEEERLAREQQALAEQEQTLSHQQQEASQNMPEQHFLQPVSMDKTMSRETSRADVESIRIYADSGVASLLASIEHEIIAMDRLRKA